MDLRGWLRDRWWTKHERTSRSLRQCLVSGPEFEFLLRSPDAVEQFHFEFPRLNPDTPESVPGGLNGVLEYVECESGTLSTKGMRWLWTANIGGVHYWLWEHVEDDAYVFMENSRGSCLLSLESRRGLSPDQFLARQYLRT